MNFCKEIIKKYSFIFFVKSIKMNYQKDPVNTTQLNKLLALIKREKLDFSKFNEKIKN